MARKPKPQDATGRTGLPAEALAPAKETLTIKAPDFRELAVTIIGMSPLMICRFSAKAMNTMQEKQMAGSTAKKGKARNARDFEADFQGARHLSPEGWDGIHAAAFRNGMISACRLVNFKMTIAKMSVFIKPDGFDIVDNVPLVRIWGGEPENKTMHTRNATGVIDLRARPMWRDWRCHLRITFDGDQFTASDVINLLSRVGMQVGVGEGRPDSRASAGMGFGTFRLATEEDGPFVELAEAA